MQKILTSLKKTEIDIHKVITTPTEKGGAITFSLEDGIHFTFSTGLKNEQAYLKHLLANKNLTQRELESYFKHMLFAIKTAKKFVAWQREK